MLRRRSWLEGDSVLHKEPSAQLLLRSCEGFMYEKILSNAGKLVCEHTRGTPIDDL